MATRLGARTKDLPKSLIPICGKPFISHQLAEIRRNGIREVVIGLGHLGDQIQSYVLDGSKWDLSVTYSDEGPVRLGTGGATRLFIEQQNITEPFFLIYGDSFLQLNWMDVKSFSEKNQGKIILAVLKNSSDGAEKWDASNVVFDGRRVLLYKKNAIPRPLDMSYIDYGLSVIQPELVRLLISPHNFSDLSDFFHEVSLGGLMVGYEVKERFFEVGSENGIQDFEKFVKAGQN